MRKGFDSLLPLAAVTMMLLVSGAWAQGMGQQDRDVFKGKLFPPNIILEYQDELGLSKDQFTAIRAAVVEVQSNVAEHEWDMREAYQQVMARLDDETIDEDAVLQNIDAVLRAENEVKKLQVQMLITLRNLLTDEQIEYLRSVRQ